MLSRSTIDYFSHFAAASKLRAVAMVCQLLIAGLVEGVGLAALVPSIEIVIADSPSQTTALSKWIVGGLASLGLPPTLPVLLGLIVVAMTLKGVLRWFALRQAGFITARVGMDLRLQLIRALLKARWRFFVTRPAGHIASAIGVEAQRAAMGFQEGCASLAGVIQVVIYAAFAALVSWHVAVAGVVAGGAVVFVLRRLVAVSRGAGQEQTRFMRSLVTHLTDALTSLKPVKAMAREEDLLKLLETDTEQLNSAQRRQVTANQSLVAFQEPIMMVFLAFGLYLALTYSDIEFPSVLLLGFLFFRVGVSVNRSQFRYQSMVAGEGAFFALRQLTTEARAASEQSSEVHRTQPKLDEGIEFRNIDYSYDQHSVLRNIEFVIPARRLVAFIGPSGVGKTTIADLLTGLLKPDSGQIRIDGHDLRDMDIVSWRRGIGYVPQEVVLLHDTVRRNIALGNSDVSDADIERALRAAGAWDFVSQLPAGIEQVVGERGMALSGGQRQRISIARAMLNRPQLLLLDEPTTALDPLAEMAICKTLTELKHSVTIVAISHQDAIRKVADIVYEVHDGSVIRQNA